MEITIIIPYSSLFPELGSQLKKGFNEALDLPGIKLNYEYVTEGSNSELIKQLKSTLISRPDLIIAHLSKFQREEVAPLIARHKVPLLVLDSGEFLPYPAENEYIIPHSAGLWKEVFSLGLYGASLEASPMIALAFYEAGYQFLTPFAMALNSASKEEYYLHLDQWKQQTEFFNAERLLSAIQNHNPSIVFAGLSGTDLDHLVKEYDESLPPLALLSTSIPDEPFHFIRAIPYLNEAKALQGNDNYFQNRQHYYWLAFSSGAAIKNALADPGNFIHAFKEAMSELNPESIPGKSIELRAEVIQENAARPAGFKSLGQVEACIATDDIHRLSKEYISGFSEPYLCH